MFQLPNESKNFKSNKVKYILRNNKLYFRIFTTTTTPLIHFKHASELTLIKKVIKTIYLMFNVSVYFEQLTFEEVALRAIYRVPYLTTA